jgi:hypothetical protein
MQNQTPAANSQAKFHISPQEASDFTNIPHSEKQTQPTKNRGQINKRMPTP